MAGKKSCNKGEIKKVGYTTKRGVKVPPTCIKDRGAPGKGPKVIPTLKEGAMMGYSTNETQKVRRRILNSLVKKESYSTVIKRLNAIRVLMRRTEPERSKKIEKDIIYLQVKFR